MTKVINIFGAPGAGKSTISAELFSKMKFGQENVELVTEWIKGKVWEEHHTIFEDQLYITAKQNRMLHRLVNKVDYIVTDSPLLLGILYTPKDYYTYYFDLVKQIFNGYNNINFLIKRTKPYNPIGRNQSEQESDAIHDKLVELLNSCGINYITINGNEFAAGKIYDYLLGLQGCEKCKFCGRECITEYDILDVCRFCAVDTGLFL